MICCLARLDTVKEGECCGGNMFIDPGGHEFFFGERVMGGSGTMGVT
jgi:hypothetical protein